ncbi:MAG: hypothetical protein KJO25_07650 [Bacteroidia bacterium]|nr:hypothetical protein [Bacteroidia bacterium]
MIFKKLLQWESEAKPLAEMPVKIKRALILIGVCLLLDLIRTILESIITDTERGWQPFASDVLYILLIGFFAYKIRQGKNWAKIVMLVIFTIDIIGLPWILIGGFMFRSALPALSVIALLQIPIVIMILVYLFNTESDHWFKGPKKPLDPVKEATSPRELSKKLWFWLIVPLGFLGYTLGCNLNTGGNVFAGMIMIFGPYILAPGVLMLLILLLIGLLNKNKLLIDVAKISLLLISFPAAYTAGVILCH